MIHKACVPGKASARAANDKKALSSRLSLVLLKEIGQCAVVPMEQDSCCVRNGLLERRLSL